LPAATETYERSVMQERQLLPEETPGTFLTLNHSCIEKIRSRKYDSLERTRWRTGRSGLHIVKNVILEQADRKNREEKILLATQTLVYIIYTNHNFDIEGRWSTHGNEESSEETREEGGQEEEVVVAP
jgi:hypothetical protein